MKTTKLLRCVIGATVMALLFLVGCQKLEPYSIDAPTDLQKRIDSVAKVILRKQQVADSIAAAWETAMEARLTEDIYQVGKTDNTTGWWGGHSKYYRLASNADSVYVKFKNFTSGKNVWSNWVQAITNDVPRGGSGYVEYAIWRADNHGNFAWGTENGVGWNTSNPGDTHGAQQTTNYSDMATENENFTGYSNLMNGADCIVLITRNEDSVKVDVKMTALSGKKLTKSYYIIENGIKDKPIRIFWTIENCHLVFYKTLHPALNEFIPDFELNPNWNSGSIVPIPEEPILTGATYRADLTATVTTVSNEVFTQTFFAEGLPYGGYGSWFVIEGGHMVMNPTETYYCALADTINSTAWYYPYSTETIVGIADNSTPWWEKFSNYTTVIGEGYFHYKFVNYTNGIANWNNWVIALTNGHLRGSNSYKECFLLRADAWGWGDYFKLANLANNYRLDGPVGDEWSVFRNYMNGATVEITLKVKAEASVKKSAKVNIALKPGETIK